MSDAATEPWATLEEITLEDWQFVQTWFTVSSAQTHQQTLEQEWNRLLLLSTILRQLS